MSRRYSDIQVGQGPRPFPLRYPWRHACVGVTLGDSGHQVPLVESTVTQAMREEHAFIYLHTHTLEQTTTYQLPTTSLTFLLPTKIEQNTTLCPLHYGRPFRTCDNVCSLTCDKVEFNISTIILQSANLRIKNILAFG